MNHNRSTKIDVFGNCLRIKQNHDDQHAEIQCRRVTTQDRGEHVQMEISVGKSTQKRTTQHHFSLMLTPDQANVLMTALSKLHPPYDEKSNRRPFSELMVSWRAFYGFPIEEA